MKKVSIKNLKNKKKGFTLVELIVVIAIIAILAAMSIPKLSEMKKAAKVSNDVAAAKNIHTIAATLDANGQLDGVEDSGNKLIYEKLDGKLQKSEGKSEYTGDVFKIEKKDNGDIIITCSEKELYPDSNGNGRKEYSEIVK